MSPMDPVAATLMTAELLGNPMHVASVLLLSPPPDAGPDFVEQLYAQAVGPELEVDPRLRRRAHRGLDTGGLWAWRDTPDIRPEEHVHRVCLPPGSGVEVLWDLVGAVHAQPLDRRRPMWEAYVVEGLEGGRVALYTKVHHALLDGISGLRLIELSMGTDPDRRGMPPMHAAALQRQTADQAERAEKADGTEKSGAPGGVMRTPLRLARSAARIPAEVVGASTRAVAGEVRSVLRGLTTDDTVLPFGAPRTRLNGALGPPRTFSAASWPRSRLRAVQDAAGVTGNDVVTAMVAGGLRSWLAAHDELPARSLVAICPVSVRGSDSEEPAGELGNAFGTALCVLGTDLDDPAARLALIHRSMSVAKRQVADLGSVASLVVAAPSILPTILLPMLPLDPGAPPGYNLPISNVPGPRSELWWNGAHLDAMYPVSIVYDGMGLNVTVCSYADRIGFGFLAGGDAVPDIELLASMTDEALQELEAAVGLVT